MLGFFFCFNIARAICDLDKVNKELIVISGDVFLVSPVDKKPSSEAVAEYLEGRKKYEELRKQKRKKGSNREEQVKYVVIHY